MEVGVLKGWGRQSSGKEIWRKFIEARNLGGEFIK